jgi:hypothetical protein
MQAIPSVIAPSGRMDTATAALATPSSLSSTRRQASERRRQVRFVTSSESIVRKASRKLKEVEEGRGRPEADSGAYRRQEASEEPRQHRFLAE